MKLIKISHGFLISNSTKIKTDLLGVIALSKNNPKITFNLICVFNGNNDFSSYEDCGLPRNLNVVRYPCNREFDLCFALINYLLKLSLEHFLILSPKLNTKILRYRIIKNRALQATKFHGAHKGLVVQKHAFLRLHKKDINAAKLIQQQLGCE